MTADLQDCIAPFRLRPTPTNAHGHILSPRPHNALCSARLTCSGLELQLEAVKKGTLESLGFKGPPGRKEEAQEQEVRRRMQLFYEELLELHRNTSRQVCVCVCVCVCVIAIFNKTHLIRKELTVAHAQMKISGEFHHKSHSGNSQQLSQEVQIKIYRRDDEMKMHFEKKALVLTKVFYGKSLIVNTGVPVEEWNLNSEEPLVLEVEFVMCGSWCLQETPRISLEMEISTPEPKRRRQRRRASKDEDCEEDECCCRKSLTVSFKDIGWSDWVVAPESYTMYFCAGSCPHNYKPASMHTQIKSRVYHLTKGATPRPSCVPAAYEPMLLMHYNSDGKLTYTLFNELVVSKCHCA
uniref:TGF-beta family profile domain-containing protein n=1 Tax=Scleropages formosus TaxID=113540 RepID=A0A8C9SIJ0_SCLFO